MTAYGDKNQLSNMLVTTEQLKQVENVTDTYLGYYDKREEPQKVDERKDNAKDMTIAYYDIATDFYEYGWGESFHFGTMNKKESRDQSILNHEYRMGMKLGLKKNDRVLDMGCGIGGPARHLASFVECRVTGLNINAAQITRARQLTKKAKLDQIVDFVEGDMTCPSFPDETFDRVYAIESICHVAEPYKVYTQAFRMLKPGGMLASYEWGLTDKYDAENPQHRKIKLDIEEGDSLPDLVHISNYENALKRAGFEVIEAEDVAIKSEVPWYSPLQSKSIFKDFRTSTLGRVATHSMLKVMEATGRAPKGTCKVHSMLLTGADGCLKGGQTGIFTPMFFLLARKPVTSQENVAPK